MDAIKGSYAVRDPEKSHYEGNCRDHIENGKGDNSPIGSPMQLHPHYPITEARSPIIHDSYGRRYIPPPTTGARMFPDLPCDTNQGSVDRTPNQVSDELDEICTILPRQVRETYLNARPISVLRLAVMLSFFYLFLQSFYNFYQLLGKDMHLQNSWNPHLQNRRNGPSIGGGTSKMQAQAFSTILSPNPGAFDDSRVKFPTSAISPYDVLFSRTTPARVAYFIQVSQTTILHLPRLIRVLHHPENLYAIHCDMKIPEEAVLNVRSEIEGSARYSKNVYFMKPEAVTYRGVTMVLNTIHGMRSLLDRDNTWSYFVNLSGADYPLLDANTIRFLLGYQLGLNFFTLAERGRWHPIAKTRMSQLWYDKGAGFAKTVSETELQRFRVHNPVLDTIGLEVAWGEAWMINSRPFCDFIVRGNMPRRLLMSFTHTADSSEHFFATVAWNRPEYQKTIVHHSMRTIVWHYKGVSSGQHPFNIDEKNDAGDFKFKEIVAESPLLFLRKFKEPNSELMDFLDKRTSSFDVIERAVIHFQEKIGSTATSTMKADSL